MHGDDLGLALKARVTRAYGVVPVTLTSMVIVVVGIVLARTTLGVTRQPLPIGWPLAVLHVVVAQSPLGEVLGSLERIAARGPVVRGLQAVFALLLMSAGMLTYVADSPGLLVLFLALGAVGFLTAARPGADPWVWTLGLGMFAVSLIFITPLGDSVLGALVDIPVWAAAGALVLAAGAYLIKGSEPLLG